MDKSQIYLMAEEASKISNEYQKLIKELILIGRRKPEIWIKLRDESTSDTQAKRKWELTADGIREKEIKYILKALAMKRSALNKEIDVLRDESRNQY